MVYCNIFIIARVQKNNNATTTTALTSVQSTFCDFNISRDRAFIVKRMHRYSTAPIVANPVLINGLSARRCDAAPPPPLLPIIMSEPAPRSIVSKTNGPRPIRLIRPPSPEPVNEAEGGISSKRIDQLLLHKTPSVCAVKVVGPPKHMCMR